MDKGTALLVVRLKAVISRAMDNNILAVTIPVSSAMELIAELEKAQQCIEGLARIETQLIDEIIEKLKIVSTETEQRGIQIAEMEKKLDEAVKHSEKLIPIEWNEENLRLVFEKWAVTAGFNIEKGQISGDYASFSTYDVWNAVNACCMALFREKDR